MVHLSPSHLSFGVVGLWSSILNGELLIYFYHMRSSFDPSEPTILTTLQIYLTLRYCNHESGDVAEGERSIPFT